MIQENHPAVQFGRWLRRKRRERDLTARVFAGRISLSHAEYAEVEAGIIRWIGEKQERLISLLLGLDDQEEAELNLGLRLARGESLLSFGDVFTREQLAPARCCTRNGKQITAEMKEAILNAVFTPLDARA